MRRIHLPLLLIPTLLLCGAWGENFTFTNSQKPVPFNEREMPPNPPLPPTQAQIVANRIGLLRFCIETLRQFDYDQRTVAGYLRKHKDGAGPALQGDRMYDVATHGFVLQENGLKDMQGLSALENRTQQWLCDRLGPQSKSTDPIPMRLADGPED